MFLVQESLSNVLPRYTVVNSDWITVFLSGLKATLQGKVSLELLANHTIPQVPHSVPTLYAVRFSEPLRSITIPYIYCMHARRKWHNVPTKELCTYLHLMDVLLLLLPFFI